LKGGFWPIKLKNRAGTTRSVRGEKLYSRICPIWNNYGGDLIDEAESPSQKWGLVHQYKNAKQTDD